MASGVRAFLDHFFFSFNQNRNRCRCPKSDNCVPRQWTRRPTRDWRYRFNGRSWACAVFATRVRENAIIRVDYDAVNTIFIDDEFVVRVILAQRATPRNIVTFIDAISETGTFECARITDGVCDELKKNKIVFLLIFFFFARANLSSGGNALRVSEPLKDPGSCARERGAQTDTERETDR